MNKKMLVLGVIGSVGLAAVALVPLAVSAATTTTDENSNITTFVQKLAEKLGLDQSTVQTAVDSVKTDLKTERDAQVATEIATAVTDGKLTQRQADILTVMQSVQLDPPTQKTQTDLSSLTEEERKAQMEADRTAREQTLVDKLNESGLNTTVDELTATQEAARTAGIRVMGFGGGHGMGFGHGGPEMM